MCIIIHKIIFRAADIYGTIFFSLGVVYLLMNFYVKTILFILAKRLIRRYVKSNIIVIYL